MTENQTIAAVAVALTLWSGTRAYNESAHGLHRYAMVIGGTVLYAIGVGVGKERRT